MTGLEPATSGVTGRCLRVIWGKMVAFVLNTSHRLPPIPTQNLEQIGTIGCDAFHSGANLGIFLSYECPCSNKNS